MTTLVELACTRLDADPDGTAYAFYERPGEPPRPIRNGDLGRAVRAVAARLQALHAPGDRVLLLLPPGRAFLYGFFGAALAGTIPVPAPPPTRSRTSRSLPPIRRIAEDCRPAAILTVAPLAAALDQALDADDELRSATVHVVEELAAGDPSGWRDPRLGPEDLAFIQYTSGSTADPRGVCVTQANLAANIATIRRGFAIELADNGVFWLPPHHDMGLIGTLLVPFAAGCDVACMSPNDFVQDPVRWLRGISERRATISGGPDFAYRLCAERIRDDQLDGVDLSTWRLAFTGAEPVSASTIDRFVERFGPLGFDRAAFYPCYGLAESTLMVTGPAPGCGPTVRSFDRATLDDEGRAVAVEPGDDRRTMVSCGSIIDPSASVLVVDPVAAEERPEGTVGEIWASGPSIAAGYFEREGETAATFGGRTSAGAGPFLRTGDLGVVVDGELYVTGRIKDTIVVNGRSLDAYDIEETIRSEVAIERAGLTAALSILDGDQERFVVVQEAAAAVDEAAVVQAIHVAVAGRFGVRPDAVELVRLGTLPRTTSGKLRRAEAAASYRRGRLRSAADSAPLGG